MTAFIDTSVLIAFHNTRDVNHERAKKLIKEAVEGKFGLLYTSDYVFNESINIALTKTGNPSIALLIGEMILGQFKGIPRFITLLRVNEGIFNEAWRLFNEYSSRGLNFTDCTTIALMKSKGIDYLISFDEKFDGIVKRVS